MKAGWEGSSEGGKVQWLQVVALETVALSWCSGKEQPGPAPGRPSDKETPVDLAFRPKKWDCGTWMGMNEKESAGESWSAWSKGHLPAEKELLVVAQTDSAAAVDPTGKAIPGLSQAFERVLQFRPVGRPEIIHTASGSESAKSAAVNSLEPAAAESAVAESVAAEFAGFGYVVAGSVAAEFAAVGFAGFGSAVAEFVAAEFADFGSAVAGSVAAEVAGFGSAVGAGCAVADAV